MRFRATWRSACNVGGAFLMLLAFGWAAPSSARADCAHYVTSLTHPDADLSRFENMLREGRIELSAQAFPFRDAAGRPARCPGGICSKRPQLPVMPAPEAPQVKEWGTVQAILPPVDRGSFAMPLDEGLARPIHRGLSVFHPPRCAPIFS